MRTFCSVLADESMTMTIHLRAREIISIDLHIWCLGADHHFDPQTHTLSQNVCQMKTFELNIYIPGKRSVITVN